MERFIRSLGKKGSKAASALAKAPRSVTDYVKPSKHLDHPTYIQQPGPIQLPPEIWEHILSFLTKADLLGAHRTSKLFRLCAIPLLFQNVEIKKDPLKVAAQMIESPLIPQRIQHMSFQKIPRAGDIPTVSAVNRVAASIDKFPRLEKISLARFTMSADTLKNLLKSESLRCIEFDAVLFQNVVLEGITSVEELSFSGPGSLVSALPLLRHTSAQLRSLKLHTNHPSILATFDSEPIRFPNLQVFHLDSAGQYENRLYQFLSSHPSITTLELISIHLKSDALTRDTLPNLTSIESTFDTIMTLVPGRSITKIKETSHPYGTVTLYELNKLAKALKKSHAKLESISIWFSGDFWDAIGVIWGISASTLKSLSVSFEPRYPDMLEWTCENDPDPAKNNPYRAQVQVQTQPQCSPLCWHVPSDLLPLYKFELLERVSFRIAEWQGKLSAATEQGMHFIKEYGAPLGGRHLKYVEVVFDDEEKAYWYKSGRTWWYGL